MNKYDEKTILSFVLPPRYTSDQTVSIRDKVRLSALKNVEILDLAPHGDHDLGTLSLSDVVSMTDSRNELTIEGDSTGDKVAFASSDGWVQGADDGTYTNSNDPTVTVKVDDDISVTVA